MSHLVGPPTQITPDVGHPHPTGRWGGPPRRDVRPYVAQRQLPRRWIGPSLPLRLFFLLWKVAPQGPQGRGSVRTVRPSTQAQAKPRTSVPLRPDHPILSHSVSSARGANGEGGWPPLTCTRAGGTPWDRSKYHHTPQNLSLVQAGSGNLHEAHESKQGPRAPTVTFTDVRPSECSGRGGQTVWVEIWSHLAQRQPHSSCIGQSP